MSIVTRFIVPIASTRVCHLREPRVTSEARNFVDVSVEAMYVCATTGRANTSSTILFTSIDICRFVGGTADFSWWNRRL